MIIVDNALQVREAADSPIRVGMIGAGFMAQGLANQIINSVPGMELTAVYGRQRDRAADVLPLFGTRKCGRGVGGERVRRRHPCRPPVATDDAFLLCGSDQIDVLVDVTGSVEFGAPVVLEAFAHGKRVVLMNAELDATIGPILQVYAQKHGVLLVDRGRRAGRTDEPVSLGTRTRDSSHA